MKRFKIGMICKYTPEITSFPHEIKKKKFLKVKVVEIYDGEYTVQLMDYPQYGHGTRDYEGEEYKGYWFVNKLDLEPYAPKHLMDLKL